MPFFRNFPHYTQFDQMDCGPTCLRMIAKFYGRNYSLQMLRDRSFLTREGVSLLGISDAAESIGLRTQGVRLSVDQLVKNTPLPCILHWDQNHFVVCYQIKQERGLSSRDKKKSRFYISDPAQGRCVFEQEEFENHWLGVKNTNTAQGTALLLYTTPAFYEDKTCDEDKDSLRKINLQYFFRYLQPHRSALLQIGLIVGMVTALQLIFPFLSQAMVDTGIENKDLGMITLILIAQLVLHISQMGIEFLRGWIVLHMTARINISLISDYLIKLMRLPISYFDTKMFGDIMQRIGDHHRIQAFLTGTSLSVIFSFSSFIVFGIILAYYSLNILGIFLLGNIFYVIWMLIFMRFRKDLDQRRFSQSSVDQSNMVELITGMQEIKLNNCEKQKRWRWERIQIKLFKINLKSLVVSQCQQIGSLSFHQLTNLVISYFSAVFVIEGKMTIGMMLSLSYIIGQLSAPISQFISFAQSLQDAKLSLERLSEIHGIKDEEEHDSNFLADLSDQKSMHIKNLWFSYDGADRDYALSDINLDIPAGKTTAFVGASGSGKTTLMKLLLGFYTPNKGTIFIGNIPLQHIHPQRWRTLTGAVMQNGHIFSDTIAENIAISGEKINKEKLFHAAQMANIKDYIESLPLSYNTKIGMEGKGLSQGQKQRIIIARAVYKDAPFLFFDEATNALDATNEKEIMNNLSSFNKDKTVVVVAHRLSTIQRADNIIVLDKGRVVEQGTHQELTARQGVYYQLVKNQLEIDV